MGRRRTSFRDRIAWALVCSALLFPPAASAQSGANVVVVANESNADSIAIAEHYAKARGLPTDNVIRLKTLPADTPEVISRLLYDRNIQKPIADWFNRHSAHDRILYIVLTKGIPLRIEGSGGRNGTQASVDSELTLLYRTLTGRAVPPHGQIDNPYFAGRAPSGQFQQFTHRNYDIFLVTRLDGFTTSDVMALIDRGTSSNKDGRVLLDQRAALDDPGNTWLRAAADRLTADGFANRVVLEGTSKPLTNEPNVLGYFSWGSTDPAIKTRKLDLGFVPGALAAAFVSTDARTFREPPSDWTPGIGGTQKAYFAGSPQSLIGDLVREGATGVAGHVAEPYRDAAIRPDLLFPAYLAGFNLAESFYLAMPYLGWQTVILGDPLCAPFRAGSPELAEIDPQIDPDTGRSEFFANRRMKILTQKGLKSDALKLFLRGEERLAQGDQAGARQALESATALEEGLNQAHVLLATIHEAAGQYRLGDRSIPTRAGKHTKRLIGTEQPRILLVCAWQSTGRCAAVRRAGTCP